MRTGQFICISIFCYVLLTGCYSRHLIDTQDLIDYEKSKILSIEMMSGENIEYKSDDIIMSKQDKYRILLYFKDGSSRKFNIEDILSIRINQFENKETIYKSFESGLLTLEILLIIGWFL